MAAFSKSYRDQLEPQFAFHTETMEGGAIRISFPNDIPPLQLSFLVNYLEYPTGFDLSSHSIAVLGRATLTDAYPIPRPELRGKKARIYVPSNDQEHDLVYIDVGSEFYEQSFTDGAWKRVQDGRVPDNVRAIW